MAFFRLAIGGLLSVEEATLSMLPPTEEDMSMFRHEGLNNNCEVSENITAQFMAFQVTAGPPEARQDWGGHSL